ncbi:MAG: DUF2256 domain-containing protein [Alphaproteobacteria bacterium]|nr:DUF2256 domain-containing protein [Alphaproteobacteria bacterium]
MKMRKKRDLPQKACAACGRPFTWRRKWEAVWDEVKFCSRRCRAARTPPSVARRTDHRTRWRIGSEGPPSSQSLANHAASDTMFKPR